MGGVGRVAAGVATGGLSEVGRKLGIGLDDEQGAYVSPERKRMDSYQNYLDNFDAQQKNAEAHIQQGAFSKGLFGEGGLQTQLGKEGQDLASRGFELTQGDREAYGQTAGDVSRMFGQQNQAAAAQLARRGLGSGASGAAGAMFSGMQGNKNEMLAQAQTSIAQKRMADTQQRLQQNRQMQSGLAQQGMDMQNRRYKDYGESLSKSTGLEGQKYEQDRQVMADQQAAVKPGLFSTIGQGLQRGIGQLAQSAPGMLAGGIGGGLASSGGNPLAAKGKYGVDGAGGTTKMSSDYLNMRE